VRRSGGRAASWRLVRRERCRAKGERVSLCVCGGGEATHLDTEQLGGGVGGHARLRHVALDARASLRRPHSRVLDDPGGLRGRQLAQALPRDDLAHLGRVNTHRGRVDIHLSKVNTHRGRVDIHLSKVNTHRGRVDIHLSKVNTHLGRG
jgi:hypothetical protein